MKESLATLIIVTLLVSSTIPIQNHPAKADESTETSWLLEIIDEDPLSSYNYASNITWITTNTSISGYSFRSTGSIGEYNVFLYIKNKLEEFGLNVTVEEINFINWGIYREPNITLNIDNKTIKSRVYPIHLTYGTGEKGLTAEIAYLPIPKIYTENPLPENISSEWNSINTTHKIVFVGKEAMYNSDWREKFLNKLSTQKPIAILYAWMTQNYSTYPIFYHSTEGRSLPFYRENKIPVAWVNKTIAKLIAKAAEENKTITVTLNIPVEEGEGKVRNIIATIPGKDKTKTVMLTAHYDSVMVPALSDNAAGVAGVLELANAFTKAYKNKTYTPPTNITFIFFTSEEAGLIGSAKYIEKHKEELNKIIGVINLDTLGSYKLVITKDPIGIQPPNEAKKVYLHEIVGDAAWDMGLNYEIEGANLHSDDSSFYAPDEVENLIMRWWPSLPIDISDARKTPALMISSAPYLYWQTDENGHRGLIHTPYDNTTSTKTYDWVNPQRLETQIKVAGLAIIELLDEFKSKPTATPIPTTAVLISIVATITITLVLALIAKKKLSETT